jgi:hypothetical protein
METRERTEPDFKREFGDEITVVGFSVRGELDTYRSFDLAAAIVEAIGMQCSHSPTLTLYPLVEGLSLGFIVQQCIVESFVTLDVWPGRNGAYVHIASCKDFSPEKLYPVFKKFGLEVRGNMGGYLSL